MSEFGTSDVFPATREHGLARLSAFRPKMAEHYARRRNFDVEGHDGVSQLSAFLRYRLITEEEVIAAAIGAHSLDQADKFIQEVFWRTYFKGWLERRPSVWRRYVSTRDAALGDLGGGLGKAYDEAVDGRTGIDCFDHWAEELGQTGYLHNHARMWFASIWTFTLGLPWVLGADFFHRHLLDGDAASNTLSWRWVAGLHTKGKTYQASASNIEKYTEGRFHPAGQLSGETPALEDDWNGEAEDAPSCLPLTDRSRGLLVLHEDDLGLDTLPLHGAGVAGVATVARPDTRSPGEVAGKVIAFTENAVADAGSRAAKKWNVSPIECRTTDDLIEAAKEAGTDRILLPYMPVGGIADTLSGLQASARAEGMNVDIIQRRHDRESWPHCSKGFFPLKKKIPSILNATGVC